MYIMYMYVHVYSNERGGRRERGERGGRGERGERRGEGVRGERGGGRE